MNKVKMFDKIKHQKINENGDCSYTSTGNNLADLLFMAEYFQKNVNEIKIGTSPKEQLFALYMRDPRFGQGRRDLGCALMDLSECTPENILIAGRADDLWKIPTLANLKLLKEKLDSGDELVRKWMPRLGKQDHKTALIFCDYWGLTKKEYRNLISCKETVEHKLSYSEPKSSATPLNKIYKEGNVVHPLVKTIDFSKVPSLAMLKYLKAFYTRPDTAKRFAKYMEGVKNNTSKMNTAVANVHDAYKTVIRGQSVDMDYSEVVDVVGKKIVEQETALVEINALCILDTSYSMGSIESPGSLVSKALSVAHAITTNSTYCKNQLIGFSDESQLLTIKGDTLMEQYESMSNFAVGSTDFGKVMQLLKGLDKYPEYIIVLSDMEFNAGSVQSKKETMEIFKKHGANTRLIWWNFNDRNRTSPEYDEWGNVYMSGYNLDALMQIPGIGNMDEYIDKILTKYKKDAQINCLDVQ